MAKFNFMNMSFTKSGVGTRSRGFNLTIRFRHVN